MKIDSIAYPCGFAAFCVQRLVVGLVLAGLMLAGLTEPASAGGSLESALAQYRTGEHDSAAAELNALIEDGSTDPRAYYFRGIIRFEKGLKDDAAADFESGARLEMSGTTRADVPKALERVQGPARQLIEQFRGAAKRQELLDSGFHQRDKAFRQMSAEGRAAWKSGDFRKSEDLLSRVIGNGSKDPRDFYFRGLSRQKLERPDDAAIDFRNAVQLELSMASSAGIDRSLELVQGPERRALAVIRQPALDIVRREQRIREREVVARLVKENFGIDLKVDRSGSGAGTAIASGSPSELPNAPVNPADPTMPVGSVSPTRTAPGSVTSAVAGASGRNISLSYLPIDTEVVIQIRVSEIWNSPLVRDFHDTDQVQQAVGQMQQVTGLSPADILSVTIGIADATTLAMTASPDPTALKESAKNVGIVIRSRSPINTQLFEQMTDVFEPADHNGTRFYRSLDAEGAPSVWLPNLDTVVLGDEARITTAIDDGADDTPRPEFQFVDPARQIAIAFVPFDPIALTDQLPEEGSGSDALDALSKAAKGQVLGIGLGIGVTDSVDLEVATLALDETASAQIGTAAEQLLEEGKGIWGLTKGAVPAPIANVVDGILRLTQGKQRKEVYTVTTRITKQSFTNLVAGVEEMMPMLSGLMMGAMMSGPGDFSAGGGFPGAEPVEAPKADRVAANLQVTAEAKLNDFGPFDNAGNQLPPGILLMLDLVGDDASAASAGGFATIMSATDNNGTELLLDTRDAFGTNGFEPIDREDFFVKHPDNGCRVHVLLAPPTDPATSIAMAEGVVKLRLITDTSEFAIDNVKSLVGQAVTSPELVAGGYQLSLSETTTTVDGTDYKQWVLKWKNPTDRAKFDQMSAGGGLGLQTPEVVDADGNVLAQFDGSSTSSFGDSLNFEWMMSLSDDQPIPDDAKIRFRDNKSVTILDVPFKVEDVTIATGNN